MSDLISRSALIEAMEKPKQCVDYGNALWSKSEIESIINKQPTVEAKPVVHGKWITHYTPLGKYYECPICGNTGDCKKNFCSYCGADMRGGKDD